MLTQARLKELVEYNPHTGVFTWRVSRPACRAGGVCGRINRYGYREIGIDGKLRRACRLAFIYMTGEEPPQHVDHINRSKGDDRWCNLRLASPSQNAANVGPKASNSTGTPGVSWDKRRGKWLAQSRINGRKVNLGRYDTVEGAMRAYNTARAQEFGEFAA